MNVRPISYKKYDVTENRFREIYYFCLQYHEWKEELKENNNTLGSRVLSYMPRGTPGNALEALVIKRARLIDKCELIEQAAIQADPELYQYIIKAVTNLDITYNYLKTTMAIPCGKNVFYERRRKFYWILSQKKKGDHGTKIKDVL
ncbi:MAG: hypothetical protein JJE17_01730 [Peptostreptococcaceae bacterium]|nr:hypothetical protein [Peptostreptococcaceae bacterium]